MAKVEGILLDAVERAEGDSTVIDLYFKDSQGKGTILHETGFHPYFYLLPEKEGDAGKLAEKASRVRVLSKDAEVGPEKVEVVDRILLGKKVKAVKVYCRQSRHLHDIRAAVKEWPGVDDTREFDVSLEHTYVTEKKLKPMGWNVAETTPDGAIKSIREEKRDLKGLVIAAFDIEVYSKIGFPDPDDARDEVILISYAKDLGSKNEVRKVFASDKRVQGLDFVELCSDEKDLIEKFAEQVRRDEVDVLIGYNSDEFDVKYLKKRAEKLKADFKIGRDGKAPRVRPGKNSTTCSITGRPHYDVYRVMMFLDRVGSINLPKYTLKKVYEHVFNEKLLEIDGWKIWKEWEDNPKKVAEYCLSDSIGTYKLGMEFIELNFELCRKAGLFLEQQSRQGTGTMVEHFLVKQSRELGWLLPRRPKQDQIMERSTKYEGAYVKEPVPGIHENIAEYDFTSFYPNIMLTHNISNETFNVKGCKKENKSPQGHSFCLDEKGFFPKVIERTMQKRKEAKAEMRKHKEGTTERKKWNSFSTALKILNNSVHWEEPIVFKQNDKIFIERIGEFIDRLSGNATGSNQAVDPPEGLQVASFDDKGVGFFPVKKLIRHDTDKKLYEVTLESGRQIKLTEDHGVFTFKEGKIAETKTSDLKIGTPVVVPLEIPSIEKRMDYLNVLNVLKTLSKEELKGLVLKISSKNFNHKSKRITRYRVLDALSKAKTPLNCINVLKKINRDSRATSNSLKELSNEGFAMLTSKTTGPGQSHFYEITPKGRKRLELERILVNTKYYGWNYYLKLADVIEHSEEFTEEELSNSLLKYLQKKGGLKPIISDLESFATLLGYYVSEGSNNKARNKSGGTSYKINIAQEGKVNRREILKCIRACFGGISVTSTFNQFSINQKAVFLLFGALGCGTGAYEKRVPSFILSLPKKEKWAFFRGYYKGDGDSIGKFPKITTVSKKLVTDLSYLLLSLGIKDISIGRDKHFFRLKIRESLPFFKHEKERIRTYPFTLPKEFVLPLFEKIKSLKTLKAKHRKSVPKNIILEAISKYENLFGKDEYSKAIEAMSHTPVGFDRVKSIEEVNNDKKYVYDLSVEGSERFFAGLGLVGIHNSYYGYLGYPRSRWYSREAAEAITGWAREYIKQTIESAEKSGFRVIYSDTDSIYVKLAPGMTEKDVKDFLEKVNTELPGTMELEFEKIYKRGLFVSTSQGEKGAKKKYALVDSKGNIKIRGFEFVRGDWAEIAKDTQMKVLEFVLRKGDDKAAIEYVHSIVERLNSKKVPLDELVIHTQITQPLSAYKAKGPHTEAARKANLKGGKYDSGSMIDFVITSQGKTISDKAREAHEVEEGDYDADYYVNNQVIPAAFRILSALGYKKEDLLHKGSQKSLQKWFS